MRRLQLVGLALCLVGLLSVILNPVVSLAQCCTFLPSGETTAQQGTDLTYPPATDFLQTLSGGSWPGASVQEFVAAPGSDTCWFSQSAIPQQTSVNSNPTSIHNWSVLGGDLWGADVVGWLQNAVDYYRQQDPRNGGDGHNLPCGFIWWQGMEIYCGSLWQTYNAAEVANELTGTIEPTTVVNCRSDMSNSDCNNE